jgi:hypothetical protein
MLRCVKIHVESAPDAGSVALTLRAGKLTYFESRPAFGKDPSSPLLSRTERAPVKFHPCRCVVHLAFGAKYRLSIFQPFVETFGINGRASSRAQMAQVRAKP